MQFVSYCKPSLPEKWPFRPLGGHKLKNYAFDDYVRRGSLADTLLAYHSHSTSEAGISMFLRPDVGIMHVDASLASS